MLRKSAQLFRYLRLRPFDSASEQGRANERYRLAAWNALASALSTGLGMLALVITIPLTLPYLGEERFGIWMTVASLAGMLSFLDMGVGNSLVNLVAGAKANSDVLRLRQLITRGLLLLVGIGMAMLVIIAIVNWIWSAEKLIKVSAEQSRHEAETTLKVFVIIFCLSIPLNGIPKVFAGLQQAWKAHLVKMSASILSLLLVCIFALSHASVPLLLFATYGVQVLMPLILLPVLWHSGLLGFSSGASRLAITADMRLMSHVGGLFLILQIGTMAGWGSDALMVSSILGASEVAKLAIVQRLFQFVTIPLAIMNAPLWAAYADARVRGDHNFIKKTLARSLITTAALACVASLTIFFAAPWIISTWVRGELSVPSGLLAAYCIWAILEASGTAFAMYLNGMNIVRVQVIVVLLFCVIAIPLKMAMTHLHGVDGVIWGGIVAYFACVVIPYLTTFRKSILNKFDERPAVAI